MLARRVSFEQDGRVLFFFLLAGVFILGETPPLLYEVRWLREGFYITYPGKVGALAILE